MPSLLNVVAIDLGNSSGRVVLGNWAGGRGVVREVYRFPNAYDLRDGHVVWDTERIWKETLRGIGAARREARGEVHSIGLDAWGAEYILIDRDGERVGEAFCLRDPRNQRAMERAFTLIPRQRIYEITGIQVMPVNTLYGLMAHLEESPGEMERARLWLGTPEYYLFRLCGVPVAEWTNAPNSQMMDAFARTWSRELCEACGLRVEQCAPIVPTGTILGPLRPALAAELGLPNTQVIAPACHDTGSAVGAIPHSHDNLAFISSGTWSLVGTVLQEPLVTDRGYQWNFTNEGGVSGTIRYLRNVIGLWLIQEVVREWNEAGNPVTAAQLADACMETSLEGPTFDISTEGPFLAPGSMASRINDALEARGFEREDRPAQLAAIIFRSLAHRYAEVIRGLKQCTGKSIERVCIVGGGVKNETLNRLTALATGLEVVRGSSEATLLGNVAVQIGAMENTRSSRQIQEIASRLTFQAELPDRRSVAASPDFLPA
jgi:rhamnulokinase